MPFAPRAIKIWAGPTLAALLALGACRFVRGQDILPPVPTPAAEVSPSPLPSALLSPTPVAMRQPVPDAEAPSISGPPSGGLPGFAPPGGGGPPSGPDEEAPSAGAPSGAEGAAAPRDPSIPSWWANVPNVQPFPPPGNTIVPPTSPGYYSLLDVLRGNYRQKPPTYPYPRFGIMMFSFYNADWRYLDTLNNPDVDPFDFLKRNRFFNDNVMFTTGGEFRYRYNNEMDSRLSGKDNVYELTRTRVYGDLWFRDIFRIYAEFINAQSFNQDLPPTPADQYNPNFLNLFADLKVLTLYNKPVYFRAGRQELLYGSQRLISPLDWANTRRTFQGLKLFWQNEKLSLDAFCVQPVVPSANSFASVNYEQLFTGLWGTYRPTKGEIVDLYYLNLDDVSHIYSGRSGVKGALNVSTVGSRWYGDRNNWLWDTEAMLQFGSYSNQGILAKAYTMGGGYRFSKIPTTPQFWVYYDTASGDPDPGNNSVHRTFNQLFPFGHYYFGMTDLVGRQNINDVHADFAFFPTRWITAFAQYHVLRLDSPKDALYNSAGVATRQDITGRSGSDVGEVLTGIINFTLDKHQNVLVQYSHLYAGDYLRKTGSGRSPEILWFMYNFRW
jgi:hypothetical protein